MSSDLVLLNRSYYALIFADTFLGLKPIKTPGTSRHMQQMLEEKLFTQQIVTMTSMAFIEYDSEKRILYSHIFVMTEAA